MLNDFRALLQRPILLMVLLLCGLFAWLAGYNTNTAASTTVPTTTQTSLPSPTPTHTIPPTPTPSPTPTPIPIALHLGDNLARFEQAYGKHNDSYDDAYAWIKKPKDPYFEINTDTPGGNTYEITQHYYVLSNPLGQGDVSLSVAQADCEKYKPTDSKLVSKQINQGGAPGIQYIYTSESLTNQLKPDDFTDDNNKPVPAGTYTLFYLGTPSTGYEQCFLQAGVRWPN